MLDLVDARPLDLPREAEQARPRRAVRPDRRVRLGSDPEHLEDVDQRLHVVDRGRLAEHAVGHRERRLVPRLPALALDRVEQGGLLAADVRPGAPAELDVERRASAHDVLAEEAVAPRLADRVLEAFGRQRILPSDVDEASLRPAGEPRDRERLHDGEGILFHHDPVLEGARLGLVGVADHVARPDGLVGDGLPLHPGGERGPAASEELRVGHRGDHRLRSHLVGRPERLVAPVRAVVVDRRGIDESGASEEPETLAAPSVRRLGCADTPGAHDRGVGSHDRVHGGSRRATERHLGSARSLREDGRRLLAHPQTGRPDPCPTARVAALRPCVRLQLLTEGEAARPLGRRGRRRRARRSRGRSSTLNIA